MTKAWTINVKYTTGDSFGSERTEETIGMVWRDLEAAKEGLRVIKKHKKACDEIRDARYQSNEEFLRAKLRDEYWFSSGKGFENNHEYNLFMLDDDSQPQRVYAFWMGYFEQIHSAHIVVHVDVGDEDSNDMEIFF